MTVVYASLTAAAYPLHALHEMPLVVHLDLVGVQPNVNLHTYQAGRHRVCPAGYPDGAPLAHPRAVADVLGHRSGRQLAQVRVLSCQLLPDQPVAPVDDPPHERRVLIYRLEVSAASEDERLRYGALQTAVSLFCNSVLVRTARVGARRLQSVVLQYGLVDLVEGATLALAQIVRRSRQVVAPDHLGNSSHSAPCSPLTSAENVSLKHTRA